MPGILADTRARLGPLPPEIAAAMDELAGELAGGGLRGLRDMGPDRAAWNEAVAPLLGRSWLDLPWYFAETYFYRRVLEATGYFGAGPLAGRDPFAEQKAEEWAPEEGPRRAAELLGAALAVPGREARLATFLRGSLWGNRADLSYNVARTLGAFAGDEADLLVDRTNEVLSFLSRRRPRLVIVIADNAGTELLMDLALIDHLAADWDVPEIELHLKGQPFFVSDAMPRDLDDALAALEASDRPDARTLAARVRALRASGRLVARTHPFYTSSLFYPALPDDLRTELARADLLVFKGDANYRRLCSDARWAPETPFADVVDYLPTPLLALRTCKSEVAVGLPPGVAQHLSAQDPRWMVNGRRGVIEARL